MPDRDVRTLRDLTWYQKVDTIKFGRADRVIRRREPWGLSSQKGRRPWICTNCHG